MYLQCRFYMLKCVSKFVARYFFGFLLINIRYKYIAVTDVFEIFAIHFELSCFVHKCCVALREIKSIRLHDFRAICHNFITNLYESPGITITFY